MAQRISKPKKLSTLNLSQLKKSYQREQEIVKTRSKFSNKNQQIIRSLALQGLKFEKKDLQYFPQIGLKRNSSKMKSVSSNKKL